MSTERLIQAAITELLNHDIVEGGDSHRLNPRTAKARRLVIKHTIDGLDKGKRGHELRSYVRREARQEAGFDPMLWLLIANVMKEIIPLIVAWWRSR